MNNETIVLGIDPGWSGGAALVGPNHKVYEVASFSTMTEVDIVREVFLMATRASISYVEKVHAMPKQGVTSMFKFGHAYGLVRSAVMAVGLGIREVTPQKWQSTLGCCTHGDKNISKNKAQMLFGDSVKVTHGIADALLIATYGVYNERKV